MPARSSIITAHKDKIFSYLEETSLTFGIMFGGITGLTTAANNLTSAVQPVMALQGVVEGAAFGTFLGMAAAYAPPVLSKIFYYGSEDKYFTTETLLTTHHDKQWRSAGLATGLLMALTLTWNAIAATDNKPINIAPLIQGGQEVLTALSESGAQFGSDYGTYSTASLHTIDPASIRFEPTQPQ